MILESTSYIEDAVDETLVDKVDELEDEMDETIEEENELSDEERLREWNEIEDLVMKYKKAFDDDFQEATENEKRRIKAESQDAAAELIQRFYPFFKKYIMLLRTGQINYHDQELKKFVSLFIEDASLKRAINRKIQSADYKKKIFYQFNFISITYGSTPELDIETDIHMLFLNMAKRYKQMGKSFCGYLYNGFKYEMSRHIKAFLKNPLNIPYKNIVYEEYIKGSGEEPTVENILEDDKYENNIGIPDMDWIQGENCSEVFATLTTIERKLIVKYYLEDWNDRQISEEFGIHINTINLKRRQAVLKLATALGIEEDDIKRSRKSGMKAIVSTKNI